MCFINKGFICENVLACLRIQLRKGTNPLKNNLLLNTKGAGPAKKGGLEGDEPAVGAQLY